MKKLFLSFFIAAIIVSCNNQEKSSAEITTADTKTDKSEATTAKDGCGSIYLFKQGAVIESANYDGTGKELGKGTSTVTKVSSEGGITTSEVEMTYHSAANPGSVHIKYKCDGNNLSFDIASLMGNFNFGNNAKVEGTEIVFPLTLTDGQTLPDASYSMSMTVGTRTMNITSNIKERKVEGIEKVTTAGGSWDCFKVTSKIEAGIKMDGSEVEKRMAEAMKTQMGNKTMSMWFAPGVGIVKMEMYDNGKVSMRSEVTRIK